MNELETRSVTEYIAGTYFGLSAACLGDVDTAVEYLEKAAHGPAARPWAIGLVLVPWLAVFALLIWCVLPSAHAEATTPRHCRPGWLCVEELRFGGLCLQASNSTDVSAAKCDGSDRQKWRLDVAEKVWNVHYDRELEHVRR